MSALGQGFPPSIQIGGGGPDATSSGPGGPPPQSDGPDTPDVEASLQKALAALKDAESDEQDHVDSQTILKCMTAIQGILAQRQKGAEAALGVSSAHKAMSRQAASAGPSY